MKPTSQTKSAFDSKEGVRPNLAKAPHTRGWSIKLGLTRVSGSPGSGPFAICRVETIKWLSVLFVREQKQQHTSYSTSMLPGHSRPSASKINEESAVAKPSGESELMPFTPRASLEDLRFPSRCRDRLERKRPSPPKNHPPVGSSPLAGISTAPSSEEIHHLGNVIWALFPSASNPDAPILELVVCPGHRQAYFTASAGIRYVGAAPRVEEENTWDEDYDGPVQDIGVMDMGHFVVFDDLPLALRLSAGAETAGAPLCEVYQIPLIQRLAGLCLQFGLDAKQAVKVITEPSAYLSSIPPDCEWTHLIVAWYRDVVYSCLLSQWTSVRSTHKTAQYNVPITALMCLTATLVIRSSYDAAAVWRDYCLEVLAPISISDRRLVTTTRAPDWTKLPRAPAAVDVVVFDYPGNANMVAGVATSGLRTPQDRAEAFMSKQDVDLAVRRYLPNVVASLVADYYYSAYNDIWLGLGDASTHATFDPAYCGPTERVQLDAVLSCHAMGGDRYSLTRAETRSRPTAPRVTEEPVCFKIGTIEGEVPMRACHKASMASALGVERSHRFRSFSTVMLALWSYVGFDLSCSLADEYETDPSPPGSAAVPLSGWAAPKYLCVSGKWKQLLAFMLMCLISVTAVPSGGRSQFELVPDCVTGSAGVAINPFYGTGISLASQLTAWTSYFDPNVMKCSAAGFLNGQLQISLSVQGASPGTVEIALAGATFDPTGCILVGTLLAQHSGGPTAGGMGYDANIWALTATVVNGSALISLTMPFHYPCGQDSSMFVCYTPTDFSAMQGTMSVAAEGSVCYTSPLNEVTIANTPLMVEGNVTCTGFEFPQTIEANCTVAGGSVSISSFSPSATVTAIIANVNVPVTVSGSVEITATVPLSVDVALPITIANNSLSVTFSPSASISISNASLQVSGSVSVDSSPDNPLYVASTLPAWAEVKLSQHFTPRKDGWIWAPTNGSFEVGPTAIASLDGTTVTIRLAACAPPADNETCHGVVIFSQATGMCSPLSPGVALDVLPIQTGTCVTDITTVSSISGSLYAQVCAVSACPSLSKPVLLLAKFITRAVVLDGEAAEMEARRRNKQMHAQNGNTTERKDNETLPLVEDEYKRSKPGSTSTKALRPSESQALANISKQIERARQAIAAGATPSAEDLVMLTKSEESRWGVSTLAPQPRHSGKGKGEVALGPNEAEPFPSIIEAMSEDGLDLAHHISPDAWDADEVKWDDIKHEFAKWFAGTNTTNRFLIREACESAASSPEAKAASELDDDSLLIRNSLDENCRRRHRQNQLETRSVGKNDKAGAQKVADKQKDAEAKAGVKAESRDKLWGGVSGPVQRLSAVAGVIRRLITKLSTPALLVSWAIRQKADHRFLKFMWERHPSAQTGDWVWARAFIESTIHKLSAKDKVNVYGRLIPKCVCSNLGDYLIELAVVCKQDTITLQGASVASGNRQRMQEWLARFWNKLMHALNGNMMTLPETMDDIEKLREAASFIGADTKGISREVAVAQLGGIEFSSGRAPQVEFASAQRLCRTVPVLTGANLRLTNTTFPRVSRIYPQFYLEANPQTGQVVVIVNRGTTSPYVTIALQMEDDEIEVTATGLNKEMAIADGSRLGIKRDAILPSGLRQDVAVIWRDAPPVGSDFRSIFFKLHSMRLIFSLRDTDGCGLNSREPGTWAEVAADGLNPTTLTINDLVGDNNAFIDHNAFPVQQCLPFDDPPLGANFSAACPSGYPLTIYMDASTVQASDYPNLIPVQASMRSWCSEPQHFFPWMCIAMLPWPCLKFLARTSAATLYNDNTAPMAQIAVPALPYEWFAALTYIPGWTQIAFMCGQKGSAYPPSSGQMAANSVAFSPTWGPYAGDFGFVPGTPLDISFTDLAGNVQLREQDVLEFITSWTSSAANGGVSTAAGVLNLASATQFMTRLTQFLNCSAATAWACELAESMSMRSPNLDEIDLGLGVPSLPATRVWIAGGPGAGPTVPQTHLFSGDPISVTNGGPPPGFWFDYPYRATGAPFMTLPSFSNYMIACVFSGMWTLGPAPGDAPVARLPGFDLWNHIAYDHISGLAAIQMMYAVLNIPSGMLQELNTTDTKFNKMAAVVRSLSAKGNVVSTDRQIPRAPRGRAFSDSIKGFVGRVFLRDSSNCDVWRYMTHTSWPSIANGRCLLYPAAQLGPPGRVPPDDVERFNVLPTWLSEFWVNSVLPAPCKAFAPFIPPSNRLRGIVDAAHQTSMAPAGPGLLLTVAEVPTLSLRRQEYLGHDNVPVFDDVEIFNRRMLDQLYFELGNGGLVPSTGSADIQDHTVMDFPRTGRAVFDRPVFPDWLTPINNPGVIENMYATYFATFAWKSSIHWQRPGYVSPNTGAQLKWAVNGLANDMFTRLNGIQPVNLTTYAWRGRLAMPTMIYSLGSTDYKSFPSDTGERVERKRPTTTAQSAPSLAPSTSAVVVSQTLSVSQPTAVPANAQAGDTK